MHSFRIPATRLGLPLLLLGASAAGATGAPSTRYAPALLEVTVNGQAAEEPLLLQQDSTGGLYASEALLRRWRLRLPSSEPLTIDGENWYRIDDAPGLRATLSAADQSLVIEARPDQFERQSADLATGEAFEMTPSGNGGFLNYDLVGEYSGGEANLSGVIEAGAFTRFGVGTTGFVVNAGQGRERLLRLDSSWTIDRPASLTSIRIGDGVTAGGVGVAPVRFGGIQYARNFATRPGYLTMPLPVLEGSAAVPSVVDVYVNNALQSSREVAPGPFELTNVPIQTGGGTVQLVMRDLLGRQVVSEQDYYASAELLRGGLHDFSYEIGFVREHYGSRSFGYGAPIAATSHRYGLTDSITIEGHAQLSRDSQGAGAGINLSLFDLGTFAGSASFSRSGSGTGALLSASFERRGTGFSAGLRTEYASADYAFVGIGEGNRPPRLSVQAFADMRLLGGSLGANLVHRDQRDAEDESLAGIFANAPLTDGATLQLFARRAMVGRSQTIVGAHVSLSLGGRRSASAGVEYEGGALSHRISFQADAPAGIGGGYRAATSLSGGRRTTESIYTYNGVAAAFGAHVSNVAGQTGVRLSARGALGLVGGRPFASRIIGESFARVHVGRHAGVRVYADNQLIGVTAADGSVVVPSLRAFDRNVIRIDETDLPLDVQIAETERGVRPFARSGAVVRFELRRERGVLIQVSLEDGTFLPAGALVRIAGSPEIHVAVSGGEIYLPALEGTATLEASWDDRRCSFQVLVPDDDDPQPRIGGLVCRHAHTFAAR